MRGVAFLDDEGGQIASSALIHRGGVSNACSQGTEFVPWLVGGHGLTCPLPLRHALPPAAGEVGATLRKSLNTEGTEAITASTESLSGLCDPLCDLRVDIFVWEDNRAEMI
jgi:hypothetical protein